MGIRLHLRNAQYGGRYLDVADTIVLGRAPADGLSQDDPAVSSEHCRFVCHEGGATVEDLHSTNGTEVNGQRVSVVELRGGERVKIGETLIDVEILSASAVATAAAELVSAVATEPASPAAKQPSGTPEAPAERHPQHAAGSRPRTRILGERDAAGKTHGASATPGASPPRKGRRAALAFAALICLGVLALMLWRGCGAGPGKAACRQMRRHGVVLTIRETAGVARHAEPVTSGVPLPEGCVRDPERLGLVDKGKKPVPCQFTPLSRWPDGSIKWVLLDFHAGVAVSNTAQYALCLNAKQPAPNNPATARSSGGSVTLENGRLKIEIATNAPGLIRSIVADGREMLASAVPAQSVLVDGSNRVWRAARPTELVVEQQGPMRATALARGVYAGDDGTALFGGRMGYDLRVSLYAGKPYAKLEFTVRNDGAFEGRKQWLHAKSLELDIPLARVEGSDREIAPPAVACGVGRFPVSPGKPVSLTQWYKYPALNDISWAYGEEEDNYWRSAVEIERERIAGLTNVVQGFYHLVTDGSGTNGFRGKAQSDFTLTRGDGTRLRLSVGKFWQNYPCGWRVEPERIALSFWPAGGAWPPSQEMRQASVYQFEGSRHKTYEFLLAVGGAGDAMQPDTPSLDQELTALAPLRWYTDTGAVWPLAPVEVAGRTAETQEAIQRYDRLQRAKVYREEGDPAGRPMLAGVPFGSDRWQKVSIESLRDRCPDVFYGFMNFGDLIWAHGYCSLFYDWPYGMLTQALRFQDVHMFQIADEMAEHRRDIDRGEGFQQYEKGYHGDQERIARSKYRNRGYRPKPSHTWNRGLLLHWALTGEARSLEAALENGQAFHRFFYDQQKLATKDKLPIGEFRVSAWAMENWLALYEYTGDAKWLACANEVFDKTLLAVERDNGSQGHILKDGKQGIQFVSYLVEPVARLHWRSGRRDAIEFLKRVLDWQQREGLVDGRMAGEKYRPLKFIVDGADVDGPEGALEAESRNIWSVSPAYGFQMADGYAFLHQAFGRPEDLAFAQKVFRDMIFYYGIPGQEVRVEDRTPLGFHFRGDVRGMAAKIHAFSTRYGQGYLCMEESLTSKK